MTVGHDGRGLVAPYRGWAELPAMGALRSSAEDMLRFLAANASPPDSPLGRALRASHQPRNSVDPAADIGLNWRIMKFGEKRIIGHGGATQGFRSFVAFDPETGVGAVALANSPVALPDLVLHLIHPEIPLSGAPVAARDEVDLPEPVLRSFVGDYELTPDRALNVTLEEGVLHVQAAGQRRLPIFPESETKFFSRTMNVQLSFTRDESGKVTGLVLHQSGRELPARRRLAPGVPLAASAGADAPLPGRRTTLPSRRTGAGHEVRVVTPRGYELSQSTRHPVVYVLDGERPVHHAASVAASLAGRDAAPGVLVVHVKAAPAPADRAAFGRFLGEELRPWVEREYRTAPFQVVVGDAGLVGAVPGAFQARVAIQPDNGARVSWRGEESAIAAAPDPHVSLSGALARIFDGWALPGIAELAARPRGAGWAEIDAHFARLSDRFGYEVVPHEDVADRAGMTLARQGNFEDALRLLERNRELHPGSARVFNHLGDAFRALCRREESRENYARAHEMARAMAYENLSNYAMELARIEREIEEGAPCTPPGARRTGIAVAPEVLRAYVGEYRFSPRFSVLVTLEGGTLYAQPTGQKRAALRAESETKFFVDGSNAQVTFVRGEDGAVSGITLLQNGRDASGRRVE